MKTQNTRRSTRLHVLTLLTILTVLTTRAATVVGNLTDISIEPLNTKLMFAPTTNVLLTPSGLSAGPPKTIDTLNGAFSLPLEAGDYTVSLPLITWRRPFVISVFSTNGTVNITNLLAPPQTYTYTNQLFSLPLHVNANRVTAWSTNGEISLVDSTTTIPAGALAPRTMILVEAFGSFSDPTVSIPSATIKLKLGSAVILTQTKSVTTGNWHLRAAITIRVAGASGTAAGTMALVQDITPPDSFTFDTQTATVDTTGSLTVDLRASIDNVTDAERIICDQLIIRLQ